MNRRHLILSAALAGAMAASFAAQAAPVAPQAGQQKCYGVAKGGQNDCASATGTHACAGLGSKKDSDPNEFKYVAAGTCEKMGGTMKPGGK
jgi:uncharacterized membrane protein